MPCICSQAHVLTCPHPARYLRHSKGSHDEPHPISFRSSVPLICCKTHRPPTQSSPSPVSRPFVPCAHPLPTTSPHYSPTTVQRASTSALLKMERVFPIRCNILDDSPHLTGAHQQQGACRDAQFRPLHHVSSRLNVNPRPWQRSTSNASS